VDLPGLDEPVGLRARAATDPDAVQAEIASGRLVAAPLWKAWRPALAPAGVRRAELVAILQGYGYELWLWAAGERTWAQCLEGLAGRVNRRTEGTKATTVKKGRAKKARRATAVKKASRATAKKATRAKKARRATVVKKASRATKAPRARKPGRR
jgi:hypothetical protein